MRIEMKTAVALLSTNLRKALPALLAVLALTSCGAGDDSSSCLFSAPAPRIDSYPPTVATAGHLYGYGVDATYSCWFFPLVSTTCGGITGLRLPAGASAGGTGVSWTPAANQVNTDVNFAISTLPDICGNRATQTWSVHVYAPPVIESFTAEREIVLPGESAVLTAVFQGTGRIDGVGPTTSGVPIATPALSTNTTFTLIVANGVGAEARQTLTVEMDIPPTVVSANPVNGAADVPVNRVLFVTFDKRMDSATITTANFLLKDGGSNPVRGTVSYVGNVATFTPTNPLAILSPYTATIANGVRDVVGNPMAVNYVWSFATGPALDTTPPAVISTSPANGAGHVAPNVLLANFSESIDPMSVNAATFILKDSSQNPVNGAVRVTNGWNSAEFLPFTALEPMSSYTAIVTTGIKDLAGNVMPADHSWTFITDAVGSWRTTSTTGAPSERSGHTAVWTGSEMIVWGRYGDSDTISSGARYSPVTDVWTPISNVGAPSSYYHSAVWTGSEMIVWGGHDGSSWVNSARYNPVTDVWTPTSNIAAPSWYYHTAVWTGSEMIVWGSYISSTGDINLGARYSPVTDVWTPASTIGAPSGRTGHTAVWTGSEMIVWGGQNNYGSFNWGAQYNPVTDVWTPTSYIGAPSGRSGHTAVWTGSEMIVWGGSDGGSSFVNSGARYYPVTGVWGPTSNIGAPSGRAGHTAVWARSEMIVWGGSSRSSLGVSPLDTGGRYRP